MFYTEGNHFRDKHVYTYAPAQQQTQYSQESISSLHSITVSSFFHRLSLSLSLCLSPSHMLSFPSLSLSPTHSLSPSLSLAPTLSIVFISLISEYQLIPNPDADFRFVRPARSSIGFSRQCAISYPDLTLTFPTTLNMHIWETYEMDCSCNILPPKHTLLSLSLTHISLHPRSPALCLPGRICAAEVQAPRLMLVQRLSEAVLLSPVV